MITISFFPLGNADTCLVKLANGKNLLFDYAHTKDEDDSEDLRFDLKNYLQKEKSFDVVAFTHLDQDHIQGASDFFYFESSKKHQDESRILIKELWVPAAVILDKGLESDDAKLIRKEARFRLKEKKGIKVFSNPDELQRSLNYSDSEMEDIKHLIIDAGKLVPGLSLKNDSLEVFVHSPFSASAEDGKKIQRNDCSLVFQLKFCVNSVCTYVLLLADSDSNILDQIVQITKSKGNEERLNWDIFKIPHHCSYKSLSEEKGTTTTEPTENVKELLGKGFPRGYLISTSIPLNDADGTQPPHREAANYYEGVANSINGEFIVTMEHPFQSAPDVLTFIIDHLKVTKDKKTGYGTTESIVNKSPKAGINV